MTTYTPQFYESFYTLDPRADWDGITLALASSGYVFDATHASWTTDVSPSEVVGSGYAQVTGINLVNGINSVNQLALFLLDSGSGPATFASMTTTDYEFVIGFQGDTLMFAVDVGSPTALIAQPLILAGELATLTGP